MSERHEKFRELAEARTNRALDAVRKIGNLSNRHLYQWEETEVRKIVKALRESIGEVERKFTGSSSERDKTFKL